MLNSKNKRITLALLILVLAICFMGCTRYGCPAEAQHHRHSY